MLQISGARRAESGVGGKVIKRWGSRVSYILYHTATFHYPVRSAYPLSPSVARRLRGGGFRSVAGSMPENSDAPPVSETSELRESPSSRKGSVSSI